VEYYGFQRRELVEALLARQRDDVRRRAVSVGERLGVNVHLEAGKQGTWVVADHAWVKGLRIVLPYRDSGGWTSRLIKSCHVPVSPGSI
jgi:hypothetical protein